jgi:hypothetical protein
LNPDSFPRPFSFPLFSSISPSPISLIFLLSMCFSPSLAYFFSY